MGTLTIEQAGLEYQLVQSNKGLRVLHGGVEIFRHWPTVSAGSPPVFTAGTLNLDMSGAKSDA